MCEAAPHGDRGGCCRGGRVLGSCASDKAAPTTAGSVASMPRVAAARLVGRPCDTASSLPPTSCYWLEVPERRDRADARTIRLWVAVIHEVGAEPTTAPTIFLTGGRVRRR